MKNSKRIFALATAGLMATTLLAGCGNGGNNDPSSVGGDDANTTNATNTMVCRCSFSRTVFLPRM